MASVAPGIEVGVVVVQDNLGPSPLESKNIIEIEECIRATGR